MIIRVFQWPARCRPVVSRLLFSAYGCGTWPPELIQLVTCFSCSSTRRPVPNQAMHFAGQPDSIHRHPHITSERSRHVGVVRARFASCAGIGSEPDALTVPATLWHNSLTGFRGRG